MTQAVTVREVNQHTSAVFQRVHDGEDLVVTRAGKPIARISRFVPGDAYEQLIAEGRVIPATSHDPTGHSHRLVNTFSAGVDLDAVLEEERAERDGL